MELKERLLAAAAKLDEYVELIEPIFKGGPENYAPATDWWCIIAGRRHNSIADARMHRMEAEVIELRQKETPLTPEEIEKLGYWEKNTVSRRYENFAKYKADSPCRDGCMMTWNAQQAANQ